MSVIKKPLLVYLILFVLSVWGITSYTSLPVSLFPPAKKISVNISVNYQTYSSKQFLDTIGRDLEAAIHTIQNDKIVVDSIISNYEKNSVTYTVNFGWGMDQTEVQQAAETKVNSALSKYEPIIKDGTTVSLNKNDQGFFAVSFFSDSRTPEELYKILNGYIKPIGSSIPDANGVTLYNPDQKEITVELMPEKLAFHQISVSQIFSVIKDALSSYNGGNATIGQETYEINVNSKLDKNKDLGNLKVGQNEQTSVFLKDLAKITRAKSLENNSHFKTSNVDSLVLFATPKEGGNIKKMSDDIAGYLEKISPDLPKDIKYKIIVNPSEFIKSSISSVINEVFMASFLAVFVLFLFIGGFRNVFTAAIEIPISLVISFGAMKLFNMNVNLISLSGLALSAGMNVDASVVVLENIFRHLKTKEGNLSYEEKYKRILAAVNEVKYPIITSTLTSLLVFLPLIFTKGITNSLLGDLAMAVIFSHSISAVVAIFLVPTIRLHLLKRGETLTIKSPIEKHIAKIEKFYKNSLVKILKSRQLQNRALIAFAIIFAIVGTFSLTTLKREIIGKPDSDWLILVINSNINDVNFLQEKMGATENTLKEMFGDQVKDSFSQTIGNNLAFVMVRMKNRRNIRKYIMETEKAFKNDTTFSYSIESWSPTEFRLPESADFKIEITGSDSALRSQVAGDIQTTLFENSVFDTINLQPNNLKKKVVETIFSPAQKQFELISRSEISQFLRTATQGMLVQNVHEDGIDLPIYLRIPSINSSSLEALAALPLGYENRIIPLGSLLTFKVNQNGGAIYKEDSVEKSVLTGKVRDSNRGNLKKQIKLARELVANIERRYKDNPAFSSANIVISEVDPSVELNEAITQLYKAFLISSILILLVLYLQFGDLKSALIGIVAIPFGVFGALLSLSIFQSTLSLNSCLGAILLNGIAVANSIILLDFIHKKSVDKAMSPEEIAAISMVRLRPILITSLTTILGMLPIALGLGEGGNTLQPLGISVSGGLFFSTLLTIYCVPSFAYRMMANQNSQKKAKEELAV